ncbi:MAG: Peptidyl-prolyl cis-trans isomerase, partial [uncultured Sphingomonadaceae bacterium]
APHCAPRPARRRPVRAAFAVAARHAQRHRRRRARRRLAGGAGGGRADGHLGRRARGGDRVGGRFRARPRRQHSRAGALALLARRFRVSSAGQLRRAMGPARRHAAPDAAARGRGQAPGGVREARAADGARALGLPRPLRERGGLPSRLPRELGRGERGCGAGPLLRHSGRGARRAAGHGRRHRALRGDRPRPAPPGPQHRGRGPSGGRDRAPVLLAARHGGAGVLQGARAGHGGAAGGDRRRPARGAAPALRGAAAGERQLPTLASGAGEPQGRLLYPSGGRGGPVQRAAAGAAGGTPSRRAARV